MVRVVVDDDRGAADHDHQAHPGLHVATQVAEEQGGAHPGEEEASPVDDEQAVEEGQRRAEEPHARRRPEGKPTSREEQEHDERHGDGLEPQQDSGWSLRIVPREDADRARERRPSIRTSTPCLDAKRHALPTSSRYSAPVSPGVLPK